ncbi:hypothetical protein ACNI65_06220 [Roseateles sp. So40a]|uniref:hypothetical protein n=1 Tax=Roseateles sp. So40a TaxID=3400226 RepID=UPI003A8BBF54
MELQEVARELLGGPALWMLLSYGRVMEGARVGRYVSGLPGDEQLELARKLSRGETVPVHLMHRHQSGNYESSSLRWEGGNLFMVFADREDPA